MPSRAATFSVEPSRAFHTFLLSIHFATERVKDFSRKFRISEDNLLDSRGVPRGGGWGAQAPLNFSEVLAKGKNQRKKRRKSEKIKKFQ